MAIAQQRGDRGRHERLEHGLHFEGHAGHEIGEGAIELELEARRRAIRVGQNSRTNRKIRLFCVGCGHLPTEAREPLADGFERRFVTGQRDARQVSRALRGDVIRGRPEPPGAHDHVVRE